MEIHEQNDDDTELICSINEFFFGFIKCLSNTADVLERNESIEFGQQQFGH